MGDDNYKDYHILKDVFCSDSKNRAPFFYNDNIVLAKLIYSLVLTDLCCQCKIKKLFKAKKTYGHHGKQREL